MVALVVEALNIHIQPLQEYGTVGWYTTYQVNSKSQVTSQRTQE